MSIQAFGSRRVTESLTALASYLDEAVQSADRIPAGEVAKLTLEDIPRDLGPRLREVCWKDRNNTTVLVHGSGLKDVKTFKLVHGIVELTAQIQDLTSKEFVAAFKEIPPGLYDAWVIDEGGQAFVLRNALKVDRPGDYGLPIQRDKHALVPNCVEVWVEEQSKEINVALIGPEANDFHDLYYVEQDGKHIEGWDVSAVGDAAAGEWKPDGFGTPLGLGAEQHRRLRIVIPKHATAGLYHVVARQKATGNEVRLVFCIR
jgi:hypothetical protein